MSRRLCSRLVSLAAIVCTSSIAQRSDAGDKSARTTPVVKAVARALPSVVNISSEKKAGSTSRWPFSSEESQRPRVNGMGSGVIIDGRGYILTNQHVVDKVQTIEVHLFDNSTHFARVIQQDKEMDLALIKIEAGRPLPSAPVGSSGDLMLGETVITIGNAFGYDSTISQGIVSAIKRNVTLSDEQVYRNLIQTDACINPGNSGGPLINVEGELIGINVATRSGAQGIGFALPIDDVKRVAVEMMSTRRLSGTWHGLVSGETWQGSDRKVVLYDVQGGSPAAEAGFLPGDQVLKVNEIEVTNPIDIERGMLDVPSGQATRVAIVRAGRPSELSLSLKPAARTPSATVADSTDSVWRALGLRLIPVTAEYVRPTRPELRGGLYIKDVSPNSPAARANLQAGDILVGVIVGERHWETMRADTVIYSLRQKEVIQSEILPYWIVRKNTLQQGQMSLAEATSSRVPVRR